MEQALWCRDAWHRLAPPRRAAIRARLVRDGSALALAWITVLDRAHPLAVWLDGDEPFEALPTEFPGGFSPRQLISSHPFTDVHPWFHPATSPASSTTPRG